MKPETIRRAGKEYPAVRCTYCNGLMWPAESMEMHEALHEVKELRHKLTKEQNRRAFTQIRNNW